MRYLVSITRKAGLSDPEGVATGRALRDLGYDEVGEVHFGRTITVEIDTGPLLDGAEGATPVHDGRIREMCERLLANPVIEDYSIEALP